MSSELKEKIMKRAIGRVSLATMVAIALVSLSGVCQADPLKPGTKAPAWILKNLEGEDVKSSEFKGKVVVLNFWATWCGPCIHEIPDFIEIQKELSDKGLTFVGVSLDQATNPVTKYVKRTKVNYPVVMGDVDVVKDFGNFGGIPQTFVIDKEGIIRVSKTGLISKQKLLEGIKPLL